eukprot:363501-Chlamydomonas_euryale.AAC.10
MSREHLLVAFLSRSCRLPPTGACPSGKSRDCVHDPAPVLCRAAPLNLLSSTFHLPAAFLPPSTFLPPSFHTGGPSWQELQLPARPDSCTLLGRAFWPPPSHLPPSRRLPSTGTCPAGKSCDCVHDPTPWRRDALPDLAPNKRLKTVGLDGSYYGTPALPPKPRAERPHGFGPCGFGANGRCDWRGAHGGGRSYSDGGGGWRAGAPSAGFHASTEGAVDSSHGGYGGAAGDSAHVHGRGPLDAVHSGGSAVAAASAGADERSRGQRQQQQRGSRHGSRTHAPDRDYGHDSCVGGGREYNSNGSGHGWDKPGRGWDNPIRSKRIDESGRGGQNWRDGGRERRHSGAKDGHSSRDGR